MITLRGSILTTLCVLFFLCAQSAISTQADSQKLAAWHKGVNGPAIHIDITTLLSQEQREIVRSGFTTFTLFSVSEKKTKDQNLSGDYRVVCKVKYDTWEERYTTTKIEPLPVGSFSGNSLDSWSRECLQQTIVDTKMSKNLSNGGQLFGTLIIRQSSLDESAKIKEWLVKQQSGLMQGLYSHMLGDMQLGGRLDMVIDIPPISTTKPVEKSPLRGNRK